jgi:hypothetical protein
MVTLGGGQPAADNVGDRERPPVPLMSGDSGGFAFSALAAGSYEITATRTGYAEGAYGRVRPNGLQMWIPLAEGERKRDIKIRVWKFGAIAGTVTDDAGEPLVGVTVRAMRTTFQTGRRKLVVEKSSTTDDRGMYRIGGLLPADYIVVVPSVQTTLPAGLAAEAEGPLGTSAVKSALSSSGIVPRSGTTLAQEIDAFVLQSSSAALSPATAPARVNGRPPVFPTTYNGDATTARQAPLIPIGSGETRGGADIHLRATPTWRVSGRLTGPPETVALQALRLFPTSPGDESNSESGLEAAATVTDRSGAFTFLGVPPGSYTLRGNQLPDLRLPSSPSRPASLTEAFWLAEPVTVGDQDVTMNVTWREAFSVSGRVVFDGTSVVPRERVVRVPILIESVDQTSIPGARTPSVIGVNNTFTTPRVPAGRYLIHLGSSPPGWALRSVMYEGRDISDVAVDLKSPATDVIMTFTDRVTSLSGGVQTPQGLAAVEATALLFPVDPDGWQDFGLNPRRLKSSRVDAAGKYGFPDVPPGDYFVIAIPDEEAAIWREPDRLMTLSRLATRVHLIEGQAATQDLRSVSVR